MDMISIRRKLMAKTQAPQPSLIPIVTITTAFDSTLTGLAALESSLTAEGINRLNKFMVFKRANPFSSSQFLVNDWMGDVDSTSSGGYRNSNTNNFALANWTAERNCTANVGDKYYVFDMMNLPPSDFDIAITSDLDNYTDVLNYCAPYLTTGHSYFIALKNMSPTYARYTFVACVVLKDSDTVRSVSFRANVASGITSNVAGYNSSVARLYAEDTLAVYDLGWYF